VSYSARRTFVRSEGPSGPKLGEAQASQIGARKRGDKRARSARTILAAAFAFRKTRAKRRAVRSVSPDCPYQTLSFILMHYELGPFIELVKGDYLWIQRISTEEFKRAKLIFVYAVIANKRSKASNH